MAKKIYNFLSVFYIILSIIMCVLFFLSFIYVVINYKNYSLDKILMAYLFIAVFTIPILVNSKLILRIRLWLNI